MKTRSWTNFPAWTLAALTLYATPSAEAQDCQDKPALLSQEWLLAKVDCGADQLVKSGTGLLEGVAKNVLSSALDAYLPGVSGLLLGGGGGDPFAEHVQRILGAIDSAKQEVIEAVLGNVKDETLLVSWPWIREELGDLTSGSLAIRMGKFPAYHANVEQMMDEVRIRLQRRENIFGLDALHSLVLLTELHAKFKPELAYLAAIDDRGMNADELDTLTAEELAEIDAAARNQAGTELRTLLVGQNGVLPYFESVGRANKYRTYSDQSFGDITGGGGPGGGGTCIPGYHCKSFRYDVSNTISLLDDQSDTGIRKTEKHTQLIKVTCDDHPNNIDDYGDCISLVYKLTLPDGTVFQSTGSQDDLQTARELQAKHKEWAYRQTLLSAYAPIRATLDAWYRAMDRTIPTFQIDRDLEAIALEGTCKLTTAGSSFFPSLPGVECSGGNFEVKQLIGSTRDGGELGGTDRRRLVNYILDHGWRSLTQMRFSAYINDPMLAGSGGPLLSEYLELIRENRAPSSFEETFRGNFAAKMLSIL